MLKLDRSFVSGSWAAPRTARSPVPSSSWPVSSSSSSSRRASRRSEQLELVRQLGCRLGQGYLMHKPMPAASIVETYPRLITGL